MMAIWLALAFVLGFVAGGVALAYRITPYLLVIKTLAEQGREAIAKFEKSQV